ncbi:Mitochondrial Ribosomal Protein Small [Trichostrongylus colubriformis]|uniref:Mitochondrial Ribosomal Protein Small n=1 Tax=Trichostrongylus colubriformis TaxID=6319 RepID=A0AAN8IQP4_TRICO
MLHRTGNFAVSIRSQSSLADKLRAVVSVDDSDKKSPSDKSFKHEVADMQAASFNEMFVMPKRKLRGQLLIEQATGRRNLEQRSRPDIHDRLSVRRPRSEEMSTDQDWTAVWPAARSFASSVVPLPVRMGTRPNPEKRAPFKKQGNLELVKIPNFLHLTPAAIEKHCNAIKKFCTEFPPELLSDQDLANSEFPLRISYNTYVHQGINIRDNRSRVVTLQVKVSALSLSPRAREKLVRLATNCYEEKSDMLTIITDRCHTRKQNLDYAFYLLTAIFHEANKVEPWEALKERADSLKVEFEGSETQKKLISVLKQVISHDNLESPLKSRVKSEDQLSSDPGVKEFAQMWNTYVNSEETPEATREYAKSIKSLFGIKPPAEHRV